MWWHFRNICIRVTAIYARFTELLPKEVREAEKWDKELLKGFEITNAFSYGAFSWLEWRKV